MVAVGMFLVTTAIFTDVLIIVILWKFSSFLILLFHLRHGGGWLKGSSVSQLSTDRPVNRKQNAPSARACLK
jgi:hypothetical protein